MFFSVRRASEVTISHSLGLACARARSAASVLSSTTSGAITPCARADFSRSVSPSICRACSRRRDEIGFGVRGGFDLVLGVEEAGLSR
jgi:hypothetical protein